MLLTDLPQFTVKTVDKRTGGLKLQGSFDRLDGVIDGWCCLFSHVETLVGSLHTIDTQRRTAEFDVFNDDPPGVATGVVYPWIYGYWLGRIVTTVVDSSHAWAPLHFEASDAEGFAQGRSTGRIRLGGKLRDGAVSMGVIPKGWNHEHCEICDTHIDSEFPDCYADNEDNWLCAACFHRWAEPHDVGFLMNP